MAGVCLRFGIPDHIECSVIEYPGWNGEAYIRYYTIVLVDEGGPQLRAHPYLGWCYRDETGVYGPLRSFDIPFDALGQWDPPTANGEVLDPETPSEASSSSGRRPIISEMDESNLMDEEPVDWDPDPEPMEEDGELEPMEQDSEPEEDEPTEEPVDAES